MPSSLHPRGTEDPITSPCWDHCPLPCIFLRMLSSYSPYRNAQVASLHSIYIQILPYRQCFPWLCDFFFWNLSKFIQWQKMVVFQYPAFSAFRRTFSTFVFLTSSQSHDLVHPSSIYFFFNDLHGTTFCFIKSSAQGFPIHINVIIRMIHLSFTGTQPGGQVCLWAVIYSDWFLFLLLLYWNRSHQLTINWPKARVFALDERLKEGVTVPVWGR